MEEKFEKYLIETPVKDFNERLFSKSHKYNLSCSYSDDGGINIAPVLNFVVFSPPLGPLISLNVKCSAADVSGTKSSLKLKRINGITFYVQYWFTLLLATFTSIWALYQIFINQFYKLEILFLPLFIFLYFFVVVFLAKGYTKNLISKVKKFLIAENIKHIKQ